MLLNSLDIFRSTVAHENHAGFLYYVKFTAPAARKVCQTLKLDNDTDLIEYFDIPMPAQIGLSPGENEKRAVPMPSQFNLAPPVTAGADDYSAYYTDIEIVEGVSIDNLGVLQLPGSTYHFTHRISPLRKAARFREIETYPYPNIDRYSDNGMAAAAQQAHKKGKYTCSFAGQIFEYAWQIRGFEQFLMDMVTNPDWCCFILDKLTDICCKHAEAAAKAGVDVIMTGDDVAHQQGLMFSVQQWQDFIKPRWAKVFAAAKAIKPDIEIWFHSDGDITELIPELIEIGVTILNPVQPECVDVDRVKKLYGDKLVFDGTIGTQTTMPFGTTQEVRDMVKNRKQVFSDEGALILSPSHTIEPEVPVDNILAFLDEAKTP